MKQSFKEGDIVVPLPGRTSSNDYMYKASKSNGGGIKEMRIKRVYSNGMLECVITKGTTIRKFYGGKFRPGETVEVQSNSVRLSPTSQLYAIC